VTRWTATIIEQSDPPAVARAGAKAIVEALEQVLAQQQTASLCLAGGTTPRAVYVELAKAALPWSRVHFFFGDERAVARSSPDSNAGLADETLLIPAAVPAENIFVIRGDAEDLAAEAARYSALLPPQLDLLLLGMGEDGHTASLFPGASSLNERSTRALSVVGPKPPPHRITITPRVLAEAKQTFLFVTGAGKAEVLAKALSSAAEELPIQRTTRVTLFADTAALAKVSSER
jgi:6-phosphogluconolactonase